MVKGVSRSSPGEGFAKPLPRKSRRFCRSVAGAPVPGRKGAPNGALDLVPALDLNVDRGDNASRHSLDTALQLRDRSDNT